MNPHDKGISYSLVRESAQNCKQEDPLPQLIRNVPWIWRVSANHFVIYTFYVASSSSCCLPRRIVYAICCVIKQSWVVYDPTRVKTWTICPIQIVVCKFFAASNQVVFILHDENQLHHCLHICRFCFWSFHGMEGTVSWHRLRILAIKYWRSKLLTQHTCQSIFKYCSSSLEEIHEGRWSCYFFNLSTIILNYILQRQLLRIWMIFAKSASSSFTAFCFHIAEDSDNEESCEVSNDVEKLLYLTANVQYDPNRRQSVYMLLCSRTVAWKFTPLIYVRYSVIALLMSITQWSQDKSYQKTYI